MKKYIWQHAGWPELYWDEQALTAFISRCRLKQHFLLGAVSVLGFDLRLQEMEIVSGPEGRQQVHYKASPADAVPEEIRLFLHWLNGPVQTDGLIRAALAHYRFVVFILLMTATAGSPGL